MCSYQIWLMVVPDGNDDGVKDLCHFTSALHSIAQHQAIEHVLVWGCASPVEAGRPPHRGAFGVLPRQ